MKYFLFLMSFLAYNESFAQLNNVLQQNVFGSNQFEVPSKTIVNPADGSIFHICQSQATLANGDKTENGFGDSDIWVLKTNPTGSSVLWDKTIGGDTADVIVDALILDNVLYLLVDSYSGVSGNKTAPNYGRNDYWLIALDMMGTILWQQSYGGENYDYASKLLMFNNTQILAIGSSSSQISGNKTTLPISNDDIWIVKANKFNGSILTQHALTCGGQFVGNINRNTDNSLLIQCSTNIQTASFSRSELGYGNYDVWIVEIDTNFNVLNDKVLGGSDSEFVRSVTNLNGFTYVLIQSYSHISGNKTAPQQGGGGYQSDYWLVKLDQNMNIIWNKTFGGSQNDKPTGLVKIGNKLVIKGNSNSPISGNKTENSFDSANDCWLITVNEDGSIFDQRVFGGSSIDEAGSLAVKNNSDIVFSALSVSPVSGNKTVPEIGNGDVWVVQVATAYLSLYDEPTIVSNVFPNPFQNKVNITFSGEEQNLVVHILSMDGKIIASQKLEKGTSQYTFELPEIGNMFMYTIKSDTHTMSGKLVRQ